MIFWISVIVVLVILLIVGIVGNRKARYNTDTYFGLTIISAIILFIVGLVVICCYCEYATFERSFEIQREIYEEISTSESTPINDLYLTTDIIEANSQLADYKASKEIFGPFSIVPERVFDIAPIGTE